MIAAEKLHEEVESLPVAFSFHRQHIFPDLKRRVRDDRSFQVCGEGRFRERRGGARSRKRRSFPGNAGVEGKPSDSRKTHTPTSSQNSLADI